MSGASVAPEVVHPSPIGRRLRGNPYWRAVRGRVGLDMLYKTEMVDPLTENRDWNRRPYRHAIIRRYTFTVTDPATVSFVAGYAGPKVVDPMAGTGYWSALLRARGADVVAYDIDPPHGPDRNGYHDEQWIPIEKLDARAAVRRHRDRTLLLSWPPYHDDVGVETVQAYGGKRIVYIGETQGGCCGTPKLFAEFERYWTPVARHRPVQWFGIHDYVTVFDRTEIHPKLP